MAGRTSPWAHPFPPTPLPGGRLHLRKRHSLISDYAWRVDYVPWLVRAAIAEFLGTFITVFFGSAAVASVRGLPLALTNGAALAGLFATFAAVSTFSPISGAFFNPSIVFGYWLLRMADGVTVVVLWAAQVAGSFAAAGLLALLLGGTASGVGAPALGSILGQKIAWGPAFLLEILLCAAIFLVIVYNFNLDFSPYPALPIGAFIGAIELAVRSVVGIGPNPIRWLGPAVVAGSYADWQVWTVAPWIGVSLLGVPVYLLDRWLHHEQRVALKQALERRRRKGATDGPLYFVQRKGRKRR